MFLAILILITFFVFYKLFREFGKTQEIVINISTTDNKADLKKLFERAASPKIAKEHKSSKEAELSKNILSIQNRIPGFAVSTFLNIAEEMFDAIFCAFVDSNHQFL
ncbi:MAG: hypothetical protein LBB34_01270, partial [Holosporales bacterium]|nr:hypothetical protein [Holosporales bacterium]